MDEGLALRCQGLCAGWGETQVVSGVDLRLPAGEVLVVLGRNGVGKSTLLSCIMGRAARHAGTLEVAGRSVVGLAPFARARLGVGYVPQEREIFPSLSVRENLLVAARPQPGGWTEERVLELFPRLGERLRNGGNQLSGGEQQMLAMGRALMGNPRLLLLDEPMEGLAPVIVEMLVGVLRRLRAQAGLSILLVEQHIGLALEFSDRVVVLDRGQVAYDNQDGLVPPDRARIEALAGVSGEG